MYVQQELKYHRAMIEHRDQFAAYEAQFRELPLEQAYKQAIENRDKFSGFQNHLGIQRIQDSDLAEIFKTNENYQRYGHLFHESEYWNNEALLIRHTEFNFTILEHLEALIAYPEYVEQIEVQAENMLKYSIFNDPNSFSYRNILKTPKDYEKVKNLPMELSLSYGVVSSTQFRMTDMMMLVLLFILSMFIFSTEREQGQLHLLRSMKYGQTRLLASKILMLVGITIFLSILFYGSIMLLAYQLYGFGDGSHAIQTIGAFKFAHLPLTVHEYLASFLLGKLMICVVLSLLIAMVFLLFHHLSQSILVLALLFSSSYMAYQFIHPASYINVLKYVNTIALFDTSHVLTYYVNLNVFGYPVSRVFVSAVVMGILFLLFIMIAYVIFIKRSERPISNWLFSGIISETINRIMDRSNRSVSLLWHEMKKQLWTAKGWIILVVALFICVQDIKGTELVMDHSQYYYNEYMKQLSGPLTEEKIEFIEHEMQRIQNVGAESALIRKQYQAGEISLEQYQIAQYELDQLSLRDRPFSDVYSQYRNLMRIKQSKDIDGYIVNLISADYLFKNVNRDRINAMLLGLLLTLYLASSYTVDHRHQSSLLLKTTKRGRKPLFHAVWLFGLGMASVLWACIYIPQYYNVMRYYPPIAWQAPIQSLRQFEELDIQLTLKQLAVITSIGQWLSVLAITLVFLALAHWLKRFSLTLLAGIAIVLCPTFTTWLGYYEVAKFTLHYPHVSYIVLPYQQIGEVYLYYAGLAVLFICCYVITWRYYNGMLGAKARVYYNKAKKGTAKEAGLD